MHLCILLIAGRKINDPLPIDARFIREVWKPDAEIQNLKEFHQLSTLSKVKPENSGIS